MPNLLYQSLADPPNPIGGQSVNLSMWYEQASEPQHIRQSRHIPNDAYSDFAYDNITGKQVVNLSMWYNAPPDVIRPKQHIPYQLGEFLSYGEGVFTSSI